MAHTCIPCDREFKSRGALTLHQKICKENHTMHEKGRQLRQKVLHLKAQKQTSLNDRKSRMTPTVDDLCSTSITAPSAMPIQVASSSSSPSLMDVDPSSSNQPPPLPVQVNQGGRPMRNCRAPRRYYDRLPEALAPVPDEVDCNPLQATPSISRIILIVRDRLRTAWNSFELSREYLHRPSHDPDAIVMPSDLAKYYPSDCSTSGPESNNDLPTEPAPSMNRSVSLLSSWQNTGSTSKSDGKLDRLVKEVLLHPDFDVRDICGFSARHENQSADAADAKELLDGFREADVEIEVPSGDTTVPPKRVNIPGLHYCPLMSVIRSMFTSPLAPKFHFSPYKLFHRSPTNKHEERVYSELYDSDAFNTEHDMVQRAQLPPDDPDCKREKVIAALMFWSDQTHLANFGTAKLWPIYMFLGNLPKYIHAKPTSGACEHIAYLPSLPDSLQDFLSSFHKRWKTQKRQILSHCGRELFHGAWKLLLDDDFLHAYKYGIVIKCFDGIEQRVYPRIFTYSADYPEKILLANVRCNGICPCPRCLVRKDKTDQMGLIPDLSFRIKNARKYMSTAVKLARNCVYTLGRSIASKPVEDLLFEMSSVPTVNAFVDRLGNNFDLSRMVVVDLLHEFEIGVWRTIFTHLIRILYAADRSGELVVKLNKRFREISTFGSGTIRRFAANASEMKKLAARDFKDLLQCAIPVFEGLLDKEHNSRLMKLLYRLAEWHGFAKLRLHTELSLDHLSKLTRELGQLVRQFRDTTCSEFNTVELPREVAARGRKEKKKDQKGKKASKSGRSLNIFTYKWHALGDYVATIRMFGGTDSYSTQVGELAHCLVKCLYRLTNKRAANKQIANRYRRREKARMALKREEMCRRVISTDDDIEQSTLLRFYITKSRNSSSDLYTFLKNKSSDPAFKGFLPKLQTHLLGRLIGQEFDGDEHEVFTDQERNSVRIIGNKIFSGRTCRINYTTYDIQRGQDTINPRSHPDIMLRSPETGDNASPYWYARVIGIFHAMVWTTDSRARGQAAQRMDFLWVRWLGVEPGYQFGFQSARLPKVGFVESDDDYAFGFVDPSIVIRGCHLIPDFVSGRTDSLLPCQDSYARISNPEDNDDWTNFYVGIFVDRDMLIRHFGGGIGHLSNAPDANPLVNQDTDEQMAATTSGTVVEAGDSERNNVVINYTGCSDDDMDADESGSDDNTSTDSDDDDDDEPEEDDDSTDTDVASDNGYDSL